MHLLLPFASLEQIPFTQLSNGVKTREPLCNLHAGPQLQFFLVNTFGPALVEAFTAWSRAQFAGVVQELVLHAQIALLLPPWKAVSERLVQKKKKLSIIESRATSNNSPQ